LVAAGELARRLMMYAMSGHAAVQSALGDRARERGLTSERNILAIADNCTGCVVETGRGWVPIGSLVPIGERDCLSNCLCTYEYR
jgi:hypothetical protein